MSHVSRNTNSYEKVCLSISDIFDRMGKDVDFLISFQDEATEWIE